MALLGRGARGTAGLGPRLLPLAPGIHSPFSSSADDRPRQPAAVNGSRHPSRASSGQGASTSVASRFLQNNLVPKFLQDFKEVEVVGRQEGAYRPRSPKRFAVVELGCHQFKVAADDLIYTERLKGVDVNDRLRLGRVLLLGSKEQTVIGRPYVEGASVLAAVEEHCRDAKVIVFKKKRRKNYEKLQGHRQDLTGIRIIDVPSWQEAPKAASRKES